MRVVRPARVGILGRGRCYELPVLRTHLDADCLRNPPQRVMRHDFSKMKMLWYSLVVTGVAAAALLNGCKPAGNAAGVASAPPPVPVQTAIAQQQDVPRLITSVGVVQALRTVSVKSQVDGMISEIHFKEGDEVKAGDLLVSLDRRPFENSLRIT